jgi:carbon-monoxide dehydrogenase large subunit
VAHVTKAPGPPRYVGARVLRVEDPKFLLGRAEYTDDVQLPGMLHCAFLRSPYAHARMRSIDVSAAQALEGVVGVFTGKDLEDEVGPYIASLDRPEVVEVAYRVIPTEKAHFVGEPIIAVVADSRYIAEDAVDLIEIDWEPLPVIKDALAALEPGAPKVHEEMPDNNFAHIEFENGDVTRLFEEADHVFSKRFHHGRYMAGPLETRAVVGDWSPATKEMTVWSSTQIPHVVRTYIAGPLGIPESHIRVVADAVGGGFGLKAHVFVEEAIIPALSRMVKRPVKWIEDRYEHLAASIHSKEIIADIDIATKADGTFLAFRCHYIGSSGAHPAYPWTSMIDPLCAANTLPGLYDIQGVRYEIDSPFSNRCTTGAYRGVGWTPGHTIREAAIDDVARRLNMDPLELRLKNTIGNDPYLSKTGMQYDGGSYRESMLKAAEMIDYENLRKRQEELRKEGRYIGIGWSPYVECASWGQAIANANGFPGGYFDSADIQVEPDGTVTITTGMHNHGQAHETVFAQLAADRLGVKMEAIKYHSNNTGRDVYGMGTYGSRSAVIGGGAVIRAAAEVREKLIRMAAHALEVSPDDIELVDSIATVKGVPGKSMTMAEIATLAYFGGNDRPEGEAALTSHRSYDPPATYSNGTTVMVIEVDIETGKFEIEKFVCVEDCGTMLNPLIVEGQIAGGVAQGLGGAVYEELVYDDEGQFLSGSLMDYLYPSSMEVPNMEMAHIQTPSPWTEGGIKGMGESGAISTPAAVVNAVADALAPFGVVVDSMPLGPDRIKRLIREAQAKQPAAA